MNLKQQTVALRALEAAALTIKENITNQEAADRFDIHRASVKYARIILVCGSEDDVELVKFGVGVSTVAQSVKSKMTDAQITELRNRIGGAPSTKLREKQKTSSTLWSSFNPMLHGLTELPSPDDMIKVVTGHGRRVETVNQHLDAALKWLQEFNNAWSEFKRNKHQDGSPDARRSNKDVGTKSSEPPPQ